MGVIMTKTKLNVYEMDGKEDQITENTVRKRPIYNVDEDADSGILSKRHKAEEDKESSGQGGEGEKWLDYETRQTPSRSCSLSSCMRFRTEVPVSPSSILRKTFSFQSQKDAEGRDICDTTASPNDSGYTSPYPLYLHSAPSLGQWSVAADNCSPAASKRGNQQLEKTSSAAVTNLGICRFKDSRALRKSYTMIKKEILPSSGLADELLQNGIIDQSKYDEIKTIKMAERGADILIKAVAYNLTPFKMDAFIKALQKCKQGHIADILTKIMDCEDLDRCEDFQANKKFTSLKTRLDKIRSFLLEDFDPKYLIDQLLEKGIIGFIDHEDIYTTQRNEDRIDATLNCVKRNLDKYLGPFCHILVQHSEYLSEKIDRLIEGTGTSDSYGKDQKHLQLTLRKGEWKVRSIGSFRGYPDMTMHVTFNAKEEHKVYDEVVKRHSEATNLPLNMKLSILHMKCNKVDEGSVVIHIQPLSSKAWKKLRSVKPDDVAAIVQSLLTKEDLEKLDASQLKTVNVKIVAHKISSGSNALNKEQGIKKEAIVEHFTYLTKSLPNLMELIPSFLQDKQITDLAKDQLKLLMNLKGEDRNEKFLKYLLQEDSERSRLVFKRELRRRRMMNILKKLESHGESEETLDSDLGIDEIRKNYSFLIDELDGREFLSIFAEKGLVGDELLEKIIGSINRRDRTKLFIDFILSSEGEAKDLFFKELQKEQQKYIYDVLWATKYPSPISSDSPFLLASIKGSICEIYTTLIEEIEPKAFRVPFVEREIFTPAEYEKLVKICPRKMRAVAFLNQLLHTESLQALKTFVWVLQRTGNDHLASRIEANIDACEDVDKLADVPKAGARQATILNAVFDAGIIRGEPFCSNDRTDDILITVNMDNQSEKDYPLSDIQDPLQLWDSESVPVCIFGGKSEENMSSKEKVIGWLMADGAGGRQLVASTDKLNDNTISISMAEHVHVENEHLEQATEAIDTLTPAISSITTVLDEKGIIDVPENIDSANEVSCSAEMSIQQSNSSGVLEFNPQEFSSNKRRTWRSFDSTFSQQRDSSASTSMSTASSATRFIEPELVVQLNGNDVNARRLYSETCCIQVDSQEPRREDSCSDVYSNDSPLCCARYVTCKKRICNYNSTIELDETSLSIKLKIKKA